MPTSFRRAPIALLLVGVCLAGCGSSGKSSGSGKQLSPSEYRAAIAKIGKQEDKAHAATNNIGGVKTVKELRQILSKFASDQQAVASAVAALKPPANARAANAELASALRETTSSLQALDSKLAQDSTVLGALGEISRDTAAQKAGRDVDNALAKLIKLGYAKRS